MEEVRSVFVEIEPALVNEPLENLSGFGSSGRVRAIEAQQLLRAAQVGGLLLEEAQAHLRTLVQDIGPGVTAGALAELGTPWRAVCDAARAQGVDLVVIGTHGFGGVDRLLGTTAAKIVNHAPCSVLVARPPA